MELPHNIYDFHEKLLSIGIRESPRDLCINMTMSEFVFVALENELHPKMQEGEYMGKTRSIACQVPEDLYQRIKNYFNK